MHRPISCDPVESSKDDQLKPSTSGQTAVRSFADDFHMFWTAWSALLAAVLVVLAVGRPCILHIFLEKWWSPIGSHAICFASGLLLLPFAKRVRLRNVRPGADARGTDDSAVYGLDHGRLNVALPPSTMWMNMGYWKVRSLKYVMT